MADSWSGALRIALAAMFVFTAVSHFHPRTRPDLIRMVPASLPAPTLLVTATGVLEFIGAIGLLVAQALPAAAYGLIALLVAMFPANIHAAREGIGDRGTPRHAARVAPAAAALLDCGPVVGSIANSLTGRRDTHAVARLARRDADDLEPEAL